MKEQEMPQDNDMTTEGHKRVLYVVDKKGDYKMGHSSGWNVQTTVTDLAWDEWKERVYKVWIEVKNHKKSPLAYYMVYKQFDKSVLAAQASINIFKLLWHLRPKPFSKLKTSVLQRYADELDISMDQLKTLPSDPYTF